MVICWDMTSIISLIKYILKMVIVNPILEAFFLKSKIISISEGSEGGVISNVL